MVNGFRQRRRRSLRPTDPCELAEASVSRTEPGERVTVEIFGGPAGALAEVVVSDREAHRTRLDARGEATLDLAPSAATMAARIDIAFDGAVRLTGRLPGSGRNGFDGTDGTAGTIGTVGTDAVDGVSS